MHTFCSFLYCLLTCHPNIPKHLKNFFFPPITCNIRILTGNPKVIGISTSKTMTRASKEVDTLTGLSGLHKTLPVLYKIIINETDYATVPLESTI